MLFILCMLTLKKEKKYEDWKNNNVLENFLLSAHRDHALPRVYNVLEGKIKNTNGL